MSYPSSADIDKILKDHKQPIDLLKELGLIDTISSEDASNAKPKLELGSIDGNRADPEPQSYYDDLKEAVRKFQPSSGYKSSLDDADWKLPISIIGDRRSNSESKPHPNYDDWMKDLQKISPKTSSDDVPLSDFDRFFNRKPSEEYNIDKILLGIDSPTKVPTNDASSSDLYPLLNWKPPTNTPTEKGSNIDKGLLDRDSLRNRLWTPPVQDRYKFLQKLKAEDTFGQNWRPPTYPTVPTHVWNDFEPPTLHTDHVFNQPTHGKRTTTTVIVLPAVLFVVAVIYLLYIGCKRKAANVQSTTPAQRENLLGERRRGANPQSAAVYIDDESQSVFPPSVDAAFAALEVDANQPSAPDELDNTASNQSHALPSAPPIGFVMENERIHKYEDLPPSYEEAVRAPVVDMTRTPSYDEAMTASQTNLSTQPPPPLYQK